MKLTNYKDKFKDERRIAVQDGALGDPKEDTRSLRSSIFEDNCLFLSRFRGALDYGSVSYEYPMWLTLLSFADILKWLWSYERLQRVGFFQWSLLG